MTMKNDAKYEIELACDFKMMQKLKKNYQFKNDMRHLANFHQSMFESLKIGALMGSFNAKFNV